MKDQEKAQKPKISTDQTNPEEMQVFPGSENEVQDAGGSSTEAIDGTKDIKPR